MPELNLTMTYQLRVSPRELSIISAALRKRLKPEDEADAMELDEEFVRLRTNAVKQTVDANEKLLKNAQR